jgi:hypothetical protein
MRLRRLIVATFAATLLRGPASPPT